ncbi:MAG: hypothetical protein ACRDJN_25490 [Chloroflexota bacterium]
MASTTTVAKDGRPGTSEATPQTEPAPLTSEEQTTASEPTLDGPAGPSSAPDTSYTLLGPPDYDNIVGGVPPSPYASAILLGGLVCLIIGAVGTAMGNDMSQWWIIGAMLVVVAVFLAGFVSRSA